jgi:GLPGLI family protein
MSKNILHSIIAVAAVILFTQSSFSQKPSKPFQGTITFNITYRGDVSPAQKGMLPTSSTVTIKDCKTKTEAVSGPVTQDAITDGSTKSETVLIDYMETKYALKITTQELAEGMAKVPSPTVNVTKETKDISGFTCKQAILTTKQDDGTTDIDTIYFSDEIGCKDLNFSDPNFKDIPGAVLQYTEFNPQISATAVYTVKEIKKTKVSDNIFLIPSDYKEVTKDELKKAFGGGE